MRGLRPVILVVSLAIVAAVLIPQLPSLMLMVSGPASARADRDARAGIEQHVNAYATQVVTASTGPAGPPVADLDEFARQKSLRYAADRTDGALTTLWVDVHAVASAALGAYPIDECYAIRLHDLGTPAATSTVTHLPTCGPVTDRLSAQDRPFGPPPTR